MYNKTKVLIVDDLIVNRTTIKLSLKNEGYEFFEANDGREAIEIALRELPSVILMDALMPIMNGFEATKKIREIQSIQRTPIIMVTSLEDKADKLHAIEVGVSDFISKPFDKVELKARCRSYVELAKLNQNYTLASVNSITNLPNKMALLKKINLLKSYGELFLIKIDNFNENENFYGHKIVENLEVAFCNELFNVGSCLGDLTIYHISSGKYALLLDNDNKLLKDEVEEFCSKFIDKMKYTKIKNDKYHFDVNITMSFASAKETLYEDANLVLSSAISQKKDFLLAEDILENIKNSLEKNLNMVQKIKTALEKDMIFPYFQPIFNNKTKKINRYEALIRMIDQKNRLIYPAQFLEVAKRAKLYPEITKLLIKEVFKVVREHNVEVSINISSLDIEDPIMHDYILEYVQKNADIAKNIIFELLEDKETQDYGMVKGFIRRVKRCGALIAIDDFGSGYSNFMRILEFEPDIIKIDGSLIKDIESSRDSRAVVETIKIFADKIGAKVVAEYVSNREIYDIVNEIEIDYTQGFYIGQAKKELFIEVDLDEVIEA